MPIEAKNPEMKADGSLLSKVNFQEILGNLGVKNESKPKPASTGIGANYFEDLLKKPQKS